jgi:hypothetical protein
MTFTLLRAGFPNSAVAIALAVVPFIALAPAHRPSHAPVQSVQMVMVAVGDTIVSGNQVVPN